MIHVDCFQNTTAHRASARLIMQKFGLFHLILLLPGYSLGSILITLILEPFNVNENRKKAENRKQKTEKVERKYRNKTQIREMELKKF